MLAELRLGWGRMLVVVVVVAAVVLILEYILHNYCTILEYL